MRREREIVSYLRAEFGTELDYHRCLWTRSIGDELRAARDDAESTGRPIACLVPARTDTCWWHDECVRGEIRFLRGRVSLEGEGGSPPFPSAVVVFERGRKAQVVWWQPEGEQLEMGMPA